MRPVQKLATGASRPTRYRLALLICALSLPWLVAGDMALCLLGVVAILSAGATWFVPELGRSLLIACGAAAACLVVFRPVMAGTACDWSALLPLRGQDSVKFEALIWLPCVLMAVARGWGIQSCRDFLREE